MNRKLRIGLLMDTATMPAWSFRMVEEIVHSDYAEIVLIILNSRPPEKASFTSRLRRNWRHQLYLAFRNYEDHRVRVQPDAFERKETGLLFAGVPVIKVNPLRKRFSDYFSAEDLDRIRPYEVDILVRLGFRILRGQILSLPKFGIWSYHHGDNDTLRGGPAGVWDVIENRPVSGSILQILTEDLDNGLLLQRSFTATEPLSIKKNRNALYWKNSSLLTNKLLELHHKGEEAFFREVRSANREPRFYSHRLYTAPTNGRFLIFLIDLVRRRIQCRWKRLFFIKEWFLLYSRGEGLSTSLWRFKKYIPPRDRIWADPFVVFHNGIWHVFIEEYIYANKRAHISCLTLDSTGRWSGPRPVVERPYHLSYPFLFEHNKQLFMILTNGRDHAIELYHCASFPETWNFERALLDNVDAFDATLVQHDQRWWMFVNVRENPGASSWDALFLFHSADPLGTNWTAHPKNPVVTDVRRARPAGQIFRHNGDMYRPSQDCSRGYGSGIRINRIDVLTGEDYQETEVAAISPSWGRKIQGIHTINHAAGLTVADAKRFRLRIFG